MISDRTPNGSAGPQNFLPRKPEHPAGANFDRGVVKLQFKKEHEKWIRNGELQSASASALH